VILCVGAVKGGVGKSLVATNFAVLRSKYKKKVLLVDADEQGTTSDWVDQRTEMGVETPWTTIRLKANAVRTEVLKLSKNYDDIIIDCGGRDTASLRAALTVAHVFLVPFQPRSFDIWTSSKVSELVSEAKIINDKLVSYAFINCAGARGSDNKDAQDILGNTEGLKLLSITVGLRKAFSNATAEGLGVIELKSDKKAAEEITALHNSVFSKKYASLRHI